MATGYTDKIKDGISPRDFILRCARAMDACIMQRDDPLSVLPPKEVLPSTCHQDRINELMEERKKLEAMSEQERTDAAIKQDENAALANRKYREERDDLLEKYNAMLTAIKAWSEPSSEHTGLKKFMIQQLEMSIKHGCTLYQREEKKYTGHEWYMRERDRILHDLGYHVIENQAEIDRAAERTKWLQELWAALPKE